MNDKRAKFWVDFGSKKTHTVVWLLSLMLVLVACSQTPSATTDAPAPESFLGLLKVEVSGTDTTNPTATAQFVDPDGVRSQAATVVPTDPPGAPGARIIFEPQAATILDDNTSNTRHISIGFDITNHSKKIFPNLTLYAVNRPTNIGGTGLAALTSATGAPISSQALARSFQPTHTMRLSGITYLPNTSKADLQLYTSSEVLGIRTQSIAAGILTSSDTVLEYGFVARNLSGGREILQRNGLSCTANSCKGRVNVSYKFPIVAPLENNPASFRLYFVVAQETTAMVSQSLEEQSANTAAGLTNTTAFAQTRILAGSTFGLNQDNTTNLCQVRTAVSTTANPSSVLMPSSVPAAPGSLDLCFGSSGKRTTNIGSGFETATSLAIQSDGKIVAAGYSSSSSFDFALVRYNTNGSLDTSFGTGGKVTTDFASSRDIAQALAIQSDGKIVVAGDSSGSSGFDFALVRYNTNGSLDTSFGTGGKVTTDIGSSSGDVANSLAIQSDGKIVLGGKSRINSNYDFALVRYNTNGSLDTGFGTGGKVTTDFASSSDIVLAMVIQSDGKIVVAGTSGNQSNNDFAVVRYNTNGSLDTSFGTGGKVTTSINSAYDSARSLAIQSDGKIVLAGDSLSSSGFDFALVRYNTNGSLDTSFGTGGKVTTAIGSTDDVAESIAIQSNGKIVLAGYTDTNPEQMGINNVFALVRYNTNGSLDTSFGTGGKVTTAIGSAYDAATSIAIQSDGKIVAAGSSHNGSNDDFALVRYNP